MLKNVWDSICERIPRHRKKSKIFTPTNSENYFFKNAPRTSEHPDLDFGNVLDELFNLEVTTQNRKKRTLWFIKKINKI